MICALFFHVVTSGCDANNETDWSQYNWAHPDRFGGHIIFVEFLAPEQERSSFDLPAKCFRYVLKEIENKSMLDMFLVHATLFTTDLIVYQGHVVRLS